MASFIRAMQQCAVLRDVGSLTEKRQFSFKWYGRYHNLQHGFSVSRYIADISGSKNRNHSPANIFRFSFHLISRIIHISLRFKSGYQPLYATKVPIHAAPVPIYIHVFHYRFPHICHFDIFHQLTSYTLLDLSDRRFLQAQLASLH